MRKELTIVAERRTERGKNEARRLRVAGRIPAVLYGAGKESTPISLDPVQIDKIMFSGSGHNTIFDVEVSGQDTTPARIVDWQHEPIGDTLLHVDLERVDLTKKLVVRVPVHTEGTPAGVKQQDGLLEIVLREIEIECLPDDIPEEFVVNVRPLMIGENLRTSDIELGDGITLKTNPDTVICHVVELRKAEEKAEEEEVEAVAGTEAETAEPAEEEKKE